jgi:hypothetical protein
VRATNAHENSDDHENDGGADDDDGDDGDDDDGDNGDEGDDGDDDDDDDGDGDDDDDDDDGDAAIGCRIQQQSQAVAATHLTKSCAVSAADDGRRSGSFSRQAWCTCITQQNVMENNSDQDILNSTSKTPSPSSPLSPLPSPQLPPAGSHNSLMRATT